MELLEGFKKLGMTKVCSLFKFMYGSKKTSRQWNIKLTSTFLAVDFCQSIYDCSLFTLNKNEDLAIISFILIICLLL